MRIAVLLGLFACNSSSPAKDNVPAAGPPCPGSGCLDAPIIPGADILYSGGSGPIAKVVIAGDQVVFEDPTCCIYVTPLAGGPTTTLVRRTLIADFAISGKQLIYVGVLENAQRMTVAGVALPGGGDKAMPPRPVPGDYDRAQIVATNSDVYVVAQTLQASALLHWSIDGSHASNVSGGGSLFGDASHAYLVDGATVRSLGSDGTIGAAVGALSDARPERFALAGDTLYYESSHAIRRAHFEAGALKNDDWSADAGIVDSIAADQGRVVWGEGHTIYTAHPAKAAVLDSPGEEIVGLALARDRIVWSVPYTYGPHATTTEERLKTQKIGFLARTRLR